MTISSQAVDPPPVTGSRASMELDLQVPQALAGCVEHQFTHVLPLRGHGMARAMRRREGEENMSTLRASSQSNPAHTIHRMLACIVAGASALASGCAAGDLDDDGYKPVEQAITSSEWGANAIARAQRWVDAAVPYSHDPIRAGVGAGHNADCSGLVSYAWSLATPSHKTWMFAGGWEDDGASYRIAWSELQPGDALNYAGPRDAGVGHVMLFVRWNDTRHYSFDAIEEIAPGYVARRTSHTLDTHWNPDAPGNPTIGSVYLPIRAASRPRGSASTSTEYHDGTTSGCSTSASGASSIWTCTGDASARQRCVNGSTVTEVCGSGCVSQPIGVNDYCAVPANETTGCAGSASGTSSIWTCMANGASRQRCVNGRTQTETCAIGCESQPVGVDDFCRPYTSTAGCGASASGTSSIWTCTAGGTSRQRCVNGTTQTDRCASGCASHPIGVDDTCASASDGDGSSAGAAAPLSGSDRVVLDGITLGANEAGWVRYIARSVVPRVAGATRDDRIRTTAYVTWWSLKEGFLSSLRSYGMSNCLENGRNTDHFDQPHECLDVMWQAGLAAIQVHDHSEATVEATALRQYGGTVSDVVRMSLRLGGIDPAGSFGTRVLADRGELRKSWLMRAPGVGFTLESPMVVDECFTGAAPSWCFGLDYARTRTQSQNIVNGLITYFRAHAP